MNWDKVIATLRQTASEDYYSSKTMYALLHFLADTLEEGQEVCPSNCECKTCLWLRQQERIR